MRMKAFILFVTLWTLVGHSAEPKAEPKLKPKEAPKVGVLECDKIFDPKIKEFKSLPVRRDSQHITEQNCANKDYNALMNLQTILQIFDESVATKLQKLIKSTKAACAKAEQAPAPAPTTVPTATASIVTDILPAYTTEQVVVFNRWQEETLAALDELFKVAKSTQTGAACIHGDNRTWCRIKPAIEELKDTCVDHNSALEALPKEAESATPSPKTKDSQPASSTPTPAVKEMVPQAQASSSSSKASQPIPNSGKADHKSALETPPKAVESAAPSPKTKDSQPASSTPTTAVKDIAPQAKTQVSSSSSSSSSAASQPIPNNEKTEPPKPLQK